MWFLLSSTMWKIFSKKLYPYIFWEKNPTTVGADLINVLVRRFVLWNNE